MSSDIEVDGVVLDVDSIYAAMNEGNKQHMANKLYKYGWYPQKIMNYIPEERALMFIDDMQVRRHDVKLVKVKDLEAGDVVYLYSPDSLEWHNKAYMVSKLFTPEYESMTRLVALEGGTQYSHHSVLGDGRFTREKTEV